MKSTKEIALDQYMIRLAQEMQALTANGDDLAVRLAEAMLDDAEIQAVQDYANTVSITRLGFNDHGPVHMRTVCCNALKMLKRLHNAGVKTNLEEEHIGSFTDSVAAVMMASFLHDFGMAIGRQDHELYSGIMAYSVIDRLLTTVLPNAEQLSRRVVIRSMAMEGILGHMGTRRIHSIEAGLILIADGCDMTKGRARIPIEMNQEPRQGDIHKYSANSINRVKIATGAERPIKIEVLMSAEVGFFQVEEVLLQKINSSPAKHLVELYAGVEGQEMKRYL